MEEEDHFALTTKIGSSRPKKWICTTIVLGVSLVVALLIIVALSAALGVQNSTKSAATKPVPCAPCNSTTPCNHTVPCNVTTPCNNTIDTVCLTPSCIDLSATVRQALNEEIDPCEDFYNFSCGGWEKRTVIPPNTDNYQMFTGLTERNLIALKKVLESGVDHKIAAVGKAIDAYESCMNTEAIDKAGIQPLRDLIDMTGGWSLLRGENSTTWSFNGESFVKERLLSSSAFFSLSVEVDALNSTRYSLAVEQFGLSLKVPSAYNNNSRLILKTLISSFISRLAPDLNKTVVEEAAAGIVDLETKLVSDVSTNISQEFGELIELRTVSNFWPDLDWVNFITKVFANASVTIDPSQLMYVATRDYFRNLTSVLSKFPAQTLENYAKWQTMRPYLAYLGGSASPSEEAMQLLASADEGPVATDRYKTCVQYVQTILPMALGRLFAAHILPEYTKGNTSQMLDYVRTSFKERLDTNTWIDNTTRDRCKEKVDAVSTFTSYPDQLFDNDYLNNLYAQYEISLADYFGNFRGAKYLQFQDTLGNLHQSVDKAKVMWSNPMTQVNAFYKFVVNSLVIMEGISRPPWFDPQWPDYFKFGALGAVTAHELTHGFDNNGRTYDMDGTYRNWWTQHSIEEFEKRQKCFVDQYSSYELYGYKVDGSNSLPDNIADNGGMKVSFQAYKDFTKRNPTVVNNKPLPALTKYTPDQMYFIGWAQLWCSLFTKEGFHKAALGDHSPGPFRVVGTVVNSPEFAETFDCPVGSNMNPPMDKKCLLW